jgi:hypothetical protein
MLIAFVHRRAALHMLMGHGGMGEGKVGDTDYYLNGLDDPDVQRCLLTTLDVPDTVRIRLEERGIRVLDFVELHDLGF